MVNLFKRFTELGLLVSGLFTVWEDTTGLIKQCRCDLAIYLINVLSYSHRIIMDHAINAPGHGKMVLIF